MDVKGLKVLGISGSPRKESNSLILLKHALQAAEEVKGIKSEFVELYGKKLFHCIGCNACIRGKTTCVFGKKDDFDEIMHQYVSADAIIISTPVYHMCITSLLKALIDRLGHSIIFGHFNCKPNRLLKVGGAIAQGGSRFGGQEFTLQFLVNSFLLMNCIPVAGNTPKPVDSYIGTAGSTMGMAHTIHVDEHAFISAADLGRKVAELTKIIHVGRHYLKDELPEEYFLFDTFYNVPKEKE